jgi:DNA topoisomerase-1
MGKNLVIVESPAKAKTIEKILGKDFVVTSSFGHIRDLADEGMAIDVEKNFEPKYSISKDKEKLVKDLKKLVKESDTVWLATDEDREGEAISWHLAQTLGLDVHNTKRIVFNEITKSAITRAIENPRTININLVNAQQARRVLDRLVGYELSPVLWKKVQPSLSAGRVQSVAVRLIVEREREIISFNYTSSYKIVAEFLVKEITNGINKIKAELPFAFKTEKEVSAFLEVCKDSDFIVNSIEVKPGTKSPSAPFTTSTLQQEASRKLGYGVTRTMSLAQRLYEAGHISYMRTDSVNLSESAISDIKNLVESEFGKNYSNPKKYVTKNESAQEAHEAIRPTNVSLQEAGADDAERRLYDLIRKRTIASQMANAQIERTIIKISIENNKISQFPNQAQYFQATGEVLKFEGFLKVYLESNDDEEESSEKENLLPAVNQNQILNRETIIATEKYSRPPARYTEASLVRKLEELGIGRPSTYAPTITTIQKRGYVIKGEREGEKRNYTEVKLVKDLIESSNKTEVFGKEKSKLFPSNIGMVVNDFLNQYFENILNYGFTASVEKQFDDIANGNTEWQNMISSFYTPFKENVESTLKDAERAKGDRLLGDDPKTGKPVFAKIGKFGPHVQLGSSEDEEKPTYAKLLEGQLIETITLEEALSLLQLPRTLGTYEDKDVSTSIGRFGPYIKHGSTFVSLPKTESPYSINLEQAITIIDNKREADANKLIAEYQFEGANAQVLRGRWGPFIQWNKINFKIPKTIDGEKITEQEVIKIITETPAKGKKPTKEVTQKAAPTKKAKSTTTKKSTKAKKS